MTPAPRARLQELVENLNVVHECIRPLDCGHHYCRYCEAGSRNGWQHSACCPYEDSVKACDKAKAVLSALAACLAAKGEEEPQGWQPIETASKDGRWLLLQGRAEKTDGCWVLPEIAGWSRSGNCWRSMDGAVVSMTHWMPLPDPPVASPASPEGEKPR